MSLIHGPRLGNARGPLVPRDREAGGAAEKIEARARALAASPTWGVVIRGHSVMETLRKYFLDNRSVSKAQLVALTRIKLPALASSPAAKQRTHDRFPNAQSAPAHRYAVAMLAALTGIPPEAISDAAPDLGLLGSAQLSRYSFVEPPRPLERSTALHDVSDWVNGPVPGMDKAIWHVPGGKVPSAAASAVEGLLGIV